MKKKFSMIWGLVAAFIVLGAVGVTFLTTGALAEPSTSPPASSEEAAAPDSENPSADAPPDKHTVDLNLTVEQKEALKTAMNDAHKSALAELVSKGTITQEQADKLMPSDSEEKSGKPLKGYDKEKLGLTDTQKQAIKDAMKSARKAALGKLVTDGVITQELSDKLSTMPKGHKRGEKSLIEGLNLTDGQKDAIKTAMNDAHKSALAELVSKGTITQEQAEKFMPPTSEDKPGDRHGTSFRKEGSGLTDAQNQAVKEALASARKAAFDKLVTDGVITQELADKLSGMPKGPGAFLKSKGKSFPKESPEQTETTALTSYR